MPRPLILLFDIDGTLLDCGGSGRLALTQAFEELHGVADAFRDTRFAGGTDYAILEEVYTRVLGEDRTTPESFAPLLDRYLELLASVLASNPRFRVFPGAEALLEAAAARGAILGIATGNVARGAAVKLSRAGLEHHFVCGGFGSDATKREDLVRVAVDRGRATARARGLGAVQSEDIWVIGDTERDVQAARAAGVRAVGVAHVPALRTELIASAPVQPWAGVQPRWATALAKRAPSICNPSPLLRM